MKTRVLLISDSARVNTGYGVVVRNIGNSLVDSNEFEVRQLGIFDQLANSNPNPEEVKFKVYPSRYNNMRSMSDKYGEKTFEDILKEYCPHIVLTIGDPWHLYYVGLSKMKHKFKWVSYVPVDGVPYPRVMPYNNKWLRLVDITSKPDYVIAFNKFGKDTLETAGVKVFDTINHGVDTDTFRPLKSKDAFKKSFFNGCKDIDGSIIFGFIGRNQYRKNLPSLLKAWKIFIEKYKPEKKCYLYFHTPNSDTFRGFNLPEIMKTLKVPDNTVILAENLGAGLGITNNDLNKLYNTFDCFVSGTMGEGWLLPALEAMSAGIPTILPNYSGHLEFAKDTSWLIKIKDYFIETISGIDRAIIDEDHLAELMNKFVTLKKEELDILSKKHIEKADSFQWIDVNKKWVDLIKNIEVEDYSFNKKDFGLRSQDEVFVQTDGRFKIVGQPIDVNVSPKNNPKIGFVSTYNEKCGIATYTKNLKESIEKVSDEKNGVIFSELKDYSVLFKQIINSNINILHWQHEPGIINSDNIIMRFLMDLKKVRPDIKNVFTLHAEYPNVKCNIDGLASLVILHNNKKNYVFRNSIVKHLDHPLPKYEVSKEIREESRKLLGVEDKFVVGFNGFMTPSKGLDAILKGLINTLSKRDDIVVYFLNAVPDNPIAKYESERLIGSISDITREVGLEKKVIIDTSFYSKLEMSKRIQAFDIGVAFMGGETLSQSGSIAEMIANHIPVVASDTNHFKHMIRKKFCFPVSDNGDVAFFAKNLAAIIDSKLIYESIRKIKETISENIDDLNYDSFATNHLELYKGLLEE